MLYAEKIGFHQREFFHIRTTPKLVFLECKQHQNVSQIYFSREPIIMAADKASSFYILTLNCDRYETTYKSNKAAYEKQHCSLIFPIFQPDIEMLNISFYLPLNFLYCITIHASHFKFNYLRKAHESNQPNLILDFCFKKSIKTTLNR